MRNLFIPISVFIATLFLFLSSCDLPLAVSSMNAPLMTNKNELHFNAGVNMLPDIGPYFSSSYAISNKFALIANYYHINSTASEIYLDEEDSLKIAQIEFGVGYYNKLNKNTTFEIYSGIGRAWNNYHAANNDFHSNFLFIQPEIGTFSKYTEFGFSPRFYIIKSTNLDDIMFMIFPTFITKLGYKYAFLTLQSGPALFIEEGIIPVTFGSIGIEIKLNKLYDKKKP